MRVATQLYFLCAASPALCWAQLDPGQTLLEIRHKVADSISRLPNYLCTETVERETIRPIVYGHAADSCDRILAAEKKSKEKRIAASMDRLRLDVAIGAKTEMYSWVGEGKFDDRALSEIVKLGTTSTGAFGSFLHAIFVSPGAAFTFKGESAQSGRAVLDYSFTVAIARSGYIVSNPKVSRITGYSGAFTVDAHTLALLRLEIYTDPFPPELEICQTNTTLDYTQVRISGVDALLPSEVTVRMLTADGQESRNRTVFTGCHQFMGESKLIFTEEPSTDSPTSAKSLKDVKLPEDVKVSVALTQKIDPATSAAGDPVTGKLTHPLKDPASGLTIPKGTKVNGRIFELLSRYGEAPTLELAVKWESLEMNGANSPLELAVKSAVSTSANLPVTRGRWPEVRTEVRPEQPGVGFFLIPLLSKNYQIPIGFEANWVTLP